jgi:ElaB/YqjD/DUF883 family membrane-anchored ribosome-binding protein
MDMPNTGARGEMDINAQVEYLRDQVDKLINERAMPRLAEMTDRLSEVMNRAEEVARRGYSVARDNVDTVSDRVKEQPMAAIIIAAIGGFLLGRMLR